MSAFDTLMKQDAFTSTDDKGKNLRWIDADTFEDEAGVKHRLAGAQAPETLHSSYDDEDNVIPGTGSVQAGGAATHGATVDLARKLGFNKVVQLGEPDKYGRPISDLVNDKGESFSQSLIDSGTQPIFHGFDKDNAKLKQSEYAQALKTGAKRDGTYVPNAFDKAADTIKQAIASEGQDAHAFQRAQKYSGEVGQIQQGIKEAKEAGREDLVRRGEAELASISQRAQADHKLNDRHQVTGMANNPLSVSWDQGWDGAKEGAYGFLQLLGDSTGSEYLEEMGTDGIARFQAKQEDYARVLTDWKDIEGFNSGVSFLANNAAMSLPYMVTTFAAAGAGAGLTALTGGGFAAVVAGSALAIGAPATVYSGQVWNEMEGEKSASIALTAGLAQAALDRLGVGAIKSAFVPKNATAQAVKKIRQTLNVSEDVAKATLAQATKGELAGFLKDSAAVAVKQQADKKLGMELLKKVGGAYVTGASGEAITEAGQEAIGYIAATQGSEKDFVWSELNERLIAAGIAGGALGGAFAAPGGIKNALANYDYEQKNLAADDFNESQAAVYAAQDRADNGGVERSVDDILLQEHQQISNGGVGGLNAGERAAAGQANYKKLTLAEKTKQALLNPLGALQGSVDNVLNTDVLARSKNARALKSLLGGGLQRIHAGSGLESAKHHQTTIYKNHVKPPQHLYAAISGGKRITKASKEGYNKAIYAQLNAAVNDKGQFDTDLIPDSAHKQALISFGNELNALSNKMLNDQNAQGAGIKKLNNYLFRYKSANKGAVHRNRKGFASLLQSEYGYDAKKANDLADVIADDPNAADLGDAFSVLDGNITSSAHKERSLNLAENPKFAEFMNNDPFANIDAAAKAASRFTVSQKYLGKDNAVISNILNKMQSEDNMDPAEVDKIAAGIKDFLDAESGNYKRPTTAVGKKLQAYQKNAMTLMTLSGLPLATLSSLVELALTQKSLTNDQIFGENGGLKAIGKEGAGTMMQAISDLGGLVTRTEKAPRQSTAGRKEIENLGFTDWDVGAGAVAGVTEVNAHQQQKYQTFFKVIGLTQFTDMTRAIRASIGADYINAKVELIANQRNNGTERTAEIQEAEEALRNLGISADLFIAQRDAHMSGIPIDPEQQAQHDAQWREGMFSWVNEAVALPNAAGRPLIYQDPRFALFTQFQGFISKFTAHHIPKMWAEQVKRGTPAQKYSAFATMATMIMLGFLSQAIKDEIKYGLDDEEDKTLGNPHLDTADYIRRGVFSSGLLGTAERAISFIDPIYESNTEGGADWAFSTAAGESPTLGYIQRVAGAAGSFMEGDVGEGSKQVIKATPYVGPFSFFANIAGEWGDKLNFNNDEE